MRRVFAGLCSGANAALSVCGLRLAEPSFNSTTAARRAFFWGKSKQKKETERDTADDESSITPAVPEHLRQYMSSQSAIDDAFVESSLDLLRLTSEMELTASEYDVLAEVSTMLFGVYGQSLSLCDQFDTLFTAMCLPCSRRHAELSRVLFVVVDSVMPTPVADLLREGEVVLFSITEEEVKSLFSAFVHAILGDPVENLPNTRFTPLDRGMDESQRTPLAMLVSQVAVAIPTLQQMKSFCVIERDAEDIALRARLFALISQLCKAFDTEGTGLIQMSELSASLRNILSSEEEVEELLGGITADSSGRIKYHQLCLMLTKPRRTPT
jgi:hypothetical protein